MNKEKLLQEITQWSQEGNISKEEIENAYNAGIGQASETMKGNKVDIFALEDILRYLGGGIVVLGIGFFLGQHWDELNVVSRIFSTLGSGIMAFFIGVSLSQRSDRVGLAQAFHLIAGLVLPVGLFVMLNELDADVSSFGVQSVVWAFLFMTYLGMQKMFAKKLFVLFAGIFGTAFFVAITNQVADGSALFATGDFGAYQALIIGVVYLLLGYNFSTTSREPLTKYLYPFGLLLFFVAALNLGGYAPDQNIFWEIIFPGLSLGAVFLSLPLRSRAFLIIGSASLVVYIFKITSEYFADSFGWPLALILAGLGMIAVGSLFVKLNTKYKSLG